MLTFFTLCFRLFSLQKLSKLDQKTLPEKSFPLSGRQTGVYVERLTAVASFITENGKHIFISLQISCNKLIVQLWQTFKIN
jgi:hypothetical protein